VTSSVVVFEVATRGKINIGLHVNDKILYDQNAIENQKKRNTEIT